MSEFECETCSKSITEEEGFVDNEGNLYCPKCFVIALEEACTEKRMRIADLKVALAEKDKEIERLKECRERLMTTPYGKLQKRIAKLEKALEFYRDRKNWQRPLRGQITNIYRDGGEQARKALEGKLEARKRQHEAEGFLHYEAKKIDEKWCVIGQPGEVFIAACDCVGRAYEFVSWMNEDVPLKARKALGGKMTPEQKKAWGKFLEQEYGTTDTPEAKEREVTYRGKTDKVKDINETLRHQVLQEVAFLAGWDAAKELLE